MEGKKISFGFLKTNKVEKPVVKETKDFIECLEEKSIKVVGGEKCEEEKPLVIPMKPNTLITAERLKEIAEKVESGLEEVMPMEKEKVEIKLEPMENETLEQMAVRELMQEAKKELKIEQQELTVPVPAKPVIEGEKESTLEDYESVPIQDFGMAMLRGMGWTANKEELAKYKQPQLRPKGLGLGADKVIKDKQKKKSSNKSGKEEELSIIKNSYVKIVAGKHSGYYGKVVSLDEDNGRVMVDITVKKETVSLSEFMMQPVTKAEFDKESKVINTSAFEEYKKNERSQNQKSSKNESPKMTEKQRDSPKVNDRETPSSSQKSNDDSKDKKEVKQENKSNDYDTSSNGREKNKQDRSRRDLSDDYDSSRRKKDYKRDSSSSEDRNKRIQKEKSRRDSSSSEDKKPRRKKDRNKRDSSSEDRDRSSRRKKEKSRRDSNSEDRSRRRKEKDKKRYSSNESLDSISDSEKKKKHKNHRRCKDSSDLESDTQKKDKRDIDKKRKGKKKKRDRDRSPNYKKHRK